MKTRSYLGSLSTFVLCLAGLGLALVPNQGRASQMFAVTGATGDGNLEKNAFYAIDVASGQATFLANATWQDAAVTPNQLAYDGDRNALIFAEHGGEQLYSYSLSSGEMSQLGSLTSLGLADGFTAGGAGDYYAGRYYFSALSAAGQNRLFSVAYDLSGQLAGARELSPLGSAESGFGALSDVAVDATTGMMYGASRIDGLNWFWRLDLNQLDDDGFDVELLGQIDNLYQLAFDENLNLWGNIWQSDGEIVRLDLTDGSILQEIQLAGGDLATEVTGDFYDLAGVPWGALAADGQAPVPEPSTACLLGLFSLLLWKRHR
ncbi:hypothetical protein [Persicirhabdus sediminis]|uniref:PEP-CTERM protein-sorting domain-containing protein n=1 Tax=Persicirhabdus sediminis TaxID=454144 RepID=A0A8J7MHB0_9BACT|nr:hypothetical protein [Persicirhabdus sediminis]MBK1791563.1 hypothetical protein [Persicirhabdus sediminis]